MIKYFTYDMANQFKFYILPQALFINPKYSKLNAEAKVLYSLLLDRNSLSIKNGWIDEEGRVYIYYSREEAMSMLGCGKNTVTALFKQLIVHDLVEEVRQGLNRPNIIYVGQFENYTPESVDNSGRLIFGSPNSQNRGVQIPKNGDSYSLKIGNQKSQKLGHNNTDVKNTDFNNTEYNNNNSMPIISNMNEIENNDVVVEHQAVINLADENKAAEKKETPLANKEVLKQYVETEGNKIEIKEIVYIADSMQIKEVCNKFNELYYAKLNKSRVKELIELKGIEKVTYYLNNLKDFIGKVKIRTIQGFFFDCVKHEYEKPVTKEVEKDKPSYSNFDQREYTEEDFEPYYANLDYGKKE